jgi:hypothetical protein
VACCTTQVATAETASNSDSHVDAEASTDRWWDDSVQQGMITATWINAQEPGGPSTEGPRIAYGIYGASDESFIWNEFWLSSREGGGQRINSIGMTLVPITLLYRRIGVGPMLDVGFERRSEDGGSVVAGIIGVGADFVVRLFRRWDFATAVEYDYRTTVDSEYQVRFGLRFHHEHISAWKKS